MLNSTHKFFNCVFAEHHCALTQCRRSAPIPRCLIWRGRKILIPRYVSRPISALPWPANTRASERFVGARLNRLSRRICTAGQNDQQGSIGRADRARRASLCRTAGDIAVQLPWHAGRAHPCGRAWIEDENGAAAAAAPWKAARRRICRLRCRANRRSVMLQDVVRRVVESSIARSDRIPRIFFRIFLRVCAPGL